VQKRGKNQCTNVLGIGSTDGKKLQQEGWNLI